MKPLTHNQLHVLRRIAPGAVPIGLLLLVAFALLLVASLVIAPPMALSAERFTLQGSDLAIYNIAGALRVEPGTGSEVVVEVTRQGRDAGDLRIETGPIGSRQTLRVIYPANQVVYPVIGFGSNTSVRVHRDGTFGGKDFIGFGNRVTVHGSGGGIEAHADLRVLVPAGRNVQIYLGAGAAVATGVNADLRLDTGMGAVRCDNIHGTLKIDTGSGTVEARGTRGALDIDTGSGSVVVEDSDGDRLHLDTGSGSVAVNRAHATVFYVDTGSGSVMAEGVDANDVHVDTGSGRVSVGFVNRARKIDVDTGSGGVLLRVPGDYAADFELDSGSGGVRVDLPHTLTKKEHGTLRGSIGSGGGTLHVDTGSGGIQVMPGKATRTS